MAPLPRHVAIIPDGNCRWARSKGRIVTGGYQAGYRALEAVITRAQDLGIGYATVYIASAENLAKRSDEWRMDFYAFAGRVLHNSLSNVILEKVKVRLVGDLSTLPNTLQRDLEDLVQRTQNNTGLVLSLAIGYSGRKEILNAVGGLIRTRKAQSQTQGESALDAPVSEEEFEKYLGFAGIPSPDLLIRTSGEIRLSGFLLWHLAYTEMAFIDELWPDFTVERFEEILADFQQRKRSFGAESHA